MDKTREYYAKRNKSDRKSQMPCSFTYKWDLKNKINQQTKQNRNKLIHTEKKLMVVIVVRDEQKRG